MRGLERAVEWLRPLVDAKQQAWDYCVVWKFSDDPSSFIEWMGCCCSGGGGRCYEDANVKEDQEHLISLCRDAHLKHAKRTKACEALRYFPFSIDTFPGIYGEVALENQPRWIINANALDSNHPHESNGTRVIIPVFEGLIELFAFKHKPKDQNTIDFIVAQCNIFIEQVTPARSYANLSYLSIENNLLSVGLNPSNEQPSFEFSNYSNDNLSDLLTENNFQNHPLPVHLLTPIPTIQTLDPSTQFNFIHPSYEGSSIGLNPSNERPSFEYSNYSNVTTRNEVSIQRPGKEPYKSKNLFAESRTRNKLRDKLYALRSLVHTTSKMDESATVRDAIEHIGELQQELKKLNEELKEIEEEECKENAELKSSKLKALVEVNQIGERDFLIYICEQKWGGFERLMEAIHSLGLQTVEVNVTTWNGMVLNSLKVELVSKGGHSTKKPEGLIDRVNRVDRIR